MAYVRGTNLTPREIIAHHERLKERQRKAALTEAKARKQEIADAALRRNMEAVKAMNIPPHPNGWANRLDLDREVAAFDKQKQVANVP